MKGPASAFAAFASIFLVGCLESEKEGFSCEETGLVTNSGSNWVYALDTPSIFWIATKYPFAYQAEILDSYSHQINSSRDSLDSAKLMSISEDENGFREISLFWLPVDEQGNEAKSGCYKARLTVNALHPLTESDIPNNPGVKVKMEWILRYIADP